MNTITVIYGDGDILAPFTTSFLGRNMYTLKASPVHDRALGTIDYETVYRHLGHPSKEVAKQAKQHTSGLLDFTIPNNSKVCPGCTKGKQPQRSFPIDSYHKYKYLIIFLDDFTSMAWTIPLCAKSAAIMATCQFLQMVKTQFQASVQGWMSDFGGEYKSTTYDDLLKGEGIRIYNSAPHVPQQNGCAERFMCTLMDKAEAMRHLACLPDSWWEFTTAHATHIYNRTPLSHLQWHTPYEALHSKQPQIDHLCVFGCTAYIFLPSDVRADKLAPKSELMVYLGVAPGNDANFLFMHSPNNVLFTAAQAKFSAAQFPKCDRPTKRSAQVPTDIPAEPPIEAPIPLIQETPPQSCSSSPDSRPVTPPAALMPIRQPPAPRKQCPPPPAVPPALRRSGRKCRIPVRPDNIYGDDRHPTEQVHDIEREDHNAH